jgi:spermidine synthase
MNVQAHNKHFVALIFLLFFISGALALTYQVVWGRMMMHIFGSTAVAVGTVLAGFMSGLAAGSWIAGKIADHASDRLRLYAWLEVGIAISALLAHHSLNQMDAVYPALYGWLGTFPIALGLARFLLVFLLVLVPTALMGATLPVITRLLVEQRDRLGARLSSLYALNTLGAVGGAMLTGFYLIGRFGIHVPVYFAIAGNALIGLIALLASWRTATAAGPPAAPGQTPALSAGGATSPATLRLIALGLGISGFTSFAYEIYWTRSLIFVLGNSTYAMTTMLTAFLTGIAMGGFAIRFLLGIMRDHVALFGWIQIFLGIFSALALTILFGLVEPESVGQMLIRSGDRPAPLVLSGFGVAFAVMLVPAMLIGMTFPLAAHITAGGQQQTGTLVGHIYAINTWGNVIGALLPGIVLLSWLGIQRGILAMASLNIILGLTVLLSGMLRPTASGAWQGLAPLLLVAALALLGRSPLEFEFPSQGESRHHETLFYQEGPVATTKVFSDPVQQDKFMSVDGIVIGGTGNTEFKQLLLAHVPKLLLDDVSTELSVGVGSGMLAGESLLHSEVLEVTGVEIEPGVIAGAAVFREQNHDVLNNDRFRIVSDDIGSFLRTRAETYQVISADEKTADEYASNGFSYSREYYQLLLAHLAPGGLVAQWVPTTLPPRQYQMILKTFAGVFPHVQLWYFLPARKLGPFNTILIGSHRPVPIEPARIDARFDRRRNALGSLERYGITSADALLPHFIAADDILRAAVADAEINSLDHPRYEFYRPWEYVRDREQKVIENHDLLLELKHLALPAYLAQMGQHTQNISRLRQSLEAEFSYLVGFRRFLTGMSLTETYRVFDEALGTAPWNDSLRARIYAQYVYLASTRRDPNQRSAMMMRAEALYSNRNR